MASTSLKRQNGVKNGDVVLSTKRLLRNSLREALRMLERSAVKVASCVLMGEGDREVPDLPDCTYPVAKAPLSSAITA